MKKNEKRTTEFYLKGVINRLNGEVYYTSSDGVNRSIISVNDNQDCTSGEYEGITRKIWLKHVERHEGVSSTILDKTYGSFLTYLPNQEAILREGDGSLPDFIVENQSIYLLIDNYYKIGEKMINKSYSSKKIKNKKIFICNISDITDMTFYTTSGWRGECYKERVYDESRERNSFSEEQWVTVLHRSTGSVTIEKDFPFKGYL